MLDEAGSERAAIAAAAIARDLRESPADGIGYSYASGRAGTALFLAHWATVGGEPADCAAALDHLEKAWTMAEENPMTLSLFAGLTGLVQASHQISRLLGVDALPRGVEAIDEALIDLLLREGWEYQYDLIYGLVGFGCYAVLHPDPATARTIGTLVLDKLAELAVADGNGVRWRTEPRHRPLARRDSLPEKYCDLGVAHGLAGVIGVLSQLGSIVAENRSSRELLGAAVAFLLRQKRARADLSCMPAFVPDEGEDCRAAWCYGDVGIGLVLIGAGQAHERPAWVVEGEGMLLRDARRSVKERRVGDCSLCHGSAGIAHLYARAYRGTGRPALREEAMRWYEWTLRERREGHGFGGYLGWVSEKQRYEPAPGLLVGSAGIGLVLSSALDDSEPWWDRLLLVG